MLTKNIEKQENNTKTYPINVGARLKGIPERHDTTVPTKNRHGITLIALVITIIVLLILAGIVLNLSIGENGIITRAQQAGINYDEAGAREKLELALLDLQAEKVVNSAYNDNTYIDNYLTKKQMTVNGNIVTVGKWQFEIDRSVPKIGNSISTPDTPVVPENPTLASKVSIGDYVGYNVTEGVEDESKLKYESPVGTGMSHGNGHSAQTFTANSNIKWRVLNVDYSSGEVTLISETPIQTDAGQDFYLRGAIGYLYAEQELNEICKIYGYGKGANTAKTFEYETGDVVEGLAKGEITGSGARSINAEDINKITGYDPAKDETIKDTYLKEYTHTIFYPTKTTESGVSQTAENRTDINNIYSYMASNYIDTTDIKYQLLIRNIENSSNIGYWLASQGSIANETIKDFNVRAVGDGYLGYGYFGECDNKGIHERNLNSFSIRPIVYLKSNLRTTGKDENGAWTISEEIS